MGARAEDIIGESELGATKLEMSLRPPVERMDGVQRGLFNDVESALRNSLTRDPGLAPDGLIRRVMREAMQ